MTLLVAVFVRVFVVTSVTSAVLLRVTVVKSVFVAVVMVTRKVVVRTVVTPMRVVVETVTLVEVLRTMGVMVVDTVLWM